MLSALLFRYLLPWKITDVAYFDDVVHVIHQSVVSFFLSNFYLSLL
jgi:hypothetical protein